jgi:xylulokinase
VLRPAKLWNDTTAAPQAARLRRALPPEEWQRRVGSVPPPAFTISKLLWLRENEPEVYARLRRIALPHDWLTLKLTGRFVSDRSDASGTGYFDASTGRYDHGILALVDDGRDWDGMMPTVLGPGDQAGAVDSTVAELIGVAPGAVVGCGAGDQHASALGLGVLPGDAVFVLGTSGVVYGRHDRPVQEATGEVNSVADAAGGYLPLVCTLNAAKVTDTIGRLLGVGHHQLSELALTAPRTEDRPVLSAYLDGERSPDRPGARGMLAGISTSTTREQLALAAYEGVILGLERGRRMLEKAGLPMDGDVICTGGGSASPAYVQVLADVTARPVVTIDQPQPVAAGMAVQAAALVTGTPLEQVRDAWAPRRTTAATPQHPLDAAVFDRYRTLTAWEGLDS